jgi:hypothetical protein|tara:strand:+ start:46 stop:339 length:294 start_codon:yes stop_codon:yes gene_type:complete
MNKNQHWQKTIDDCRASGLTQKAFCQQRNIKIHTFHYWLKKISEKQTSEGSFIPFQTTESAAKANIQIGHAKITLHINDISALLSELDQAGLLYDPA